MKNTKHSFFFIIISLILIFYLIFYFAFSIKYPKQNNQTKLIKLHRHYMLSTLYYSGLFSSNNTENIISHVEGVINAMHFQYGNSVKQGQLLFEISSEKLQNDYRNALIQYIKNKSDYDSNIIQLNESEYLYQNKLISKDEFHSKQIGFYNSQLSFVQSKLELQEFIKKLNLSINLSAISINKINNIINSLNLQNDSESIFIYAPVSGTILMSTKDEGELKKLTLGDTVKLDDKLAVINHTSEYSIHIKVNEYDINKLQLGQIADITPIAYPDLILKGKIVNISQQAEENPNGLADFLVEVRLEKLFPAQQLLIHDGMNAKIAIKIKSKPMLLLPIIAVLQINGEPYVKKINNLTKKTELVAVKTIETNLNAVAVFPNEHLQAGDTIVLPG